MKLLRSGNDGFVSVSLFILFIYLYQTFYYYYNKISYIIEIRKNIIHIYEQKILEIIG